MARVGAIRGVLLSGALALPACARNAQEAPVVDSGVETTETIAGNDDLAIRVTLSTYYSERRVGAGAIVRVENATGLFLETAAGDDGVAHPRVDLAKGPFDVTIAHPSSRTMLSIVGVTTVPVGDVALVTDAAPHVGVTIRGTLKGRTTSGRVFVDGPLFTTQNLPAGITSYTASAWRLPAFPLSVTALEVDDKGAPLNAAFVPTMPRPSGETVLDLEFPSPAATPSRATMHLELPTSGVLAASDLALDAPLVPDLPGAIVVHEEPGCDCTMMLGGGAVKGFGAPKLDVDAWWFPRDVAPNETVLRVRAGPFSGMLRLGPPSASTTKIPFAETVEANGTSPDDVVFDVDAREWAHAMVLVSNAQRFWWIYSQGRGRLRRGLPHLPSGFSMLAFGGSVDLLPGVADDDRTGRPPWASNARSSSLLRDKLTLSVSTPAADQSPRVDRLQRVRRPRGLGPWWAHALLRRVVGRARGPDARLRVRRRGWPRPRLRHGHGAQLGQRRGLAARVDESDQSDPDRRGRGHPRNLCEGTMRRLGLLVLLSSCAAPSISLGPTSETKVGALTVEAWAVGLSDRNGVDHVARRDAIAAAVAATEADAVCLTEIAFDDDLDAVVNAAKARFPFTVHQVFDRRTVTDDRGIDGKVVAMPDSPPCAASDAPVFDAALACMASKCARPDGSLAPECRLGCMPPGDVTRCNVCLWNGMSARRLESVRAPCFEDPRGELAVDGRVQVLLLSKHPLRDARVVPTLGTASRAAVATAIAETNQGPVGLACLHITNQGPGNYRGPFLPQVAETTSNSYAEFGLQAVRLVETIHAMEVPTIVFGHPQFAWQVSRTGKLLGECAFTPTFVSNFALVTRPELEPLTFCTQCNPKDEPPRAGYVLEMVLLHRVASFETTLVERTHLDKTLSLDGTAVWPSTSGAGLRVTVKL